MVINNIRPLPKGKRYNISLTYLLHYQYRSIAMLAMQNKTYIKDHNGNKKKFMDKRRQKTLGEVRPQTSLTRRQVDILQPI